MTETFHKKPPTTVQYKDREDWLAGRNKSIGASEVAIILGQASYKSPLDLWKEKTGRKTPDDISEDERVSYGTEAEEHLRALFALKHRRDYKVEYKPFLVYHHGEKPYMTCTLDGELVRLSDGKRGVWECKTALIQSKRALEEWDGRIPNNYFCQVVDQLNITQFDFLVLSAELRFPDNTAEIREYIIEADEVRGDMAYVEEEVTKFWRYIESDRQPPVVIRI
jgi:putative phage-type endonuclease